MLRLLADSDRYSCVANWDTGGSVFLDFLSIGAQLLSKQEELVGGSGQLLEELTVGLNSLANRIGQLPHSTPRETCVLCGFLCKIEQLLRFNNRCSVNVIVRVIVCFSEQFVSS